jgi:putative spermidine/putrescine transport system ATP-binding protein
MPYVELQELRRVFGTDVVALDGISISLEAGEFVSLLGPSGCGKTTALRLVAGFDRPTSGQVVVDGKDVTHVPPNRRDMGMVFQAYSLFPNLTAEKNVEFGLRIRGKARVDRRTRVAELLELVGLGHAARRYPHQLSGGMQQRVALARALAIEPRVLLLDEPLSALDAKVRVQLREEIRRIQLELGITTIYVTHDQEEALSISDRVAVMYRGKIEQIGTPADMYGAPRTPFVAEFIGTMNRLPSTVAADGWVEHGGVRLRVDAAAGRAPGERVLLLVRPETMELEPADGAAPGEGVLDGTIVTHTFLGAATRIRVDIGDGEITADVPTARSGELTKGTRVHARFPSDSARLIELGEGDVEAIVADAAAEA